MLTFKNRLLLGAAVALGGQAAVLVPAQAQQIEEIVVTSRKVQENLQEVPLSITAFSANAIRDQNIRSVYELQNATPNFTMDKNFGRQADRPVIRGQSNVSTGVENRNASFFVDGAYVSGSVTGIPTDALERIEVIRGPQAALYGRATFAGAINYVTKEPSNSFEGQVNGRIGSHNDYKGSFWMRGPIIEDRLQFFLSGNWEAYGGQYKNNNPGVANSAIFPNGPTRGDQTKMGDEDTKEFNAKLRLLATDTIQFNAKVAHSHLDDGPFPFVFQGGTELNCYLPVAGTSTARSRGYYCGEFKVGKRTPTQNLADFIDGITSIFGASPPVKPGLRRDTWRTLLDMRIDIGEWNFLAQGAYNTQYDQDVNDADYTTARYLNGSFASDSRDALKDGSVELLLTSPQKERIRGSLGFYYFKDKDVAKSLAYTGFPPVVFTTPTIKRITNTSGFGRLQFDLSDAVTVSAEGRYAHETKTVSGTTRAAQGTYTSFTPRFTVDYKLNSDVLLYALAARGNKPGDINTGLFQSANVSDASFAAALAAGQTLVKEEKEWTYEAGVKTTLLDGRATFNVDGFYIDWTDQQVSTNIPIINPQGVASTANITINAGTSRVIGLEVESQFAVTPNWTLSLAYGLADAKIRKYDDSEIAITTGITDPTLANGGNAKGKTLPLVPKHTLNLGVTYRNHFAGDVDWFLSNNLRYQSKQFTEFANYAWTGGFALWNARLGIETKSWNLAVYGNNLTDDRTPNGALRYIDGTVPSFPGGTRRGFVMGLRRGREFGLTGQYNF
jgi:outer membrane receptor protein involved in Fe transport